MYSIFMYLCILGSMDPKDHFKSIYGHAENHFGNQRSGRARPATGLRAGRRASRGNSLTFGMSCFTLVMMGVGLGEESMFGEFGKDADIRIMLLLTLYILLVPIMAMNLLVAM